VIDKIFEWLFAVIVVLAILPCIVCIVVHTLGPIFITVGIVAVIVGVYRSYERSVPRCARPRNGNGGERQPVFPQEDQ
jgi:predicted cation transporter